MLGKNEPIYNADITLPFLRQSLHGDTATVNKEDNDVLEMIDSRMRSKDIRFAQRRLNHNQVQERVYLRELFLSLFI